MAVEDQAGSLDTQDTFGSRTLGKTDRLAMRPLASRERTRPRVVAKAGLGLALLLFAATSSAVSAGSGGSGDRVWEITPFVGYRIGGDVEEISTSRSYDFDSAASYGLTVGRWIGEDQRLELTWNRQPSGLEGIDYDVDIDYLQFAGVYEPSREKKAGGYVLASLGVTRFDPAESGAESSVFFSGSVGGGGRFRLSERLALRLEGRGYYTLTSGSTGVFCSGGCVFALSGTGLLQLEISAGLAIAF